ncbi:MAG: hypothetical protein IJY87_03040 [Bacilli bacterium]|nr:hypothetical protein [Bacilli bacterium]
MGLIWEVIKALANSGDDAKHNSLSEECDMIGLDKHEKEEVMKGRQDPYDFEYDGDLETDYYKDDDR